MPSQVSVIWHLALSVCHLTVFPPASIRWRFRVRFAPWSLCLLMLFHFGSRILFGPQAARAEDDSSSLFVLAIGTSQFQDRSVPELQFADDDVRGIVRWSQGQTGRLFGSVKVQSLTNKEASRAAIVKALSEFPQAARPTDQIVVYFAGHGWTDPRSGQFYYMPFDTDPQNIIGTGLEYYKALGLLEADGGDKKSILVLMDVCHTGDAAPVKQGEDRQRGSGTRPFPTSNMQIALATSDATSPSGTATAPTSQFSTRGAVDVVLPESQEFSDRVAGRDQIWAIYSASGPEGKALEGSRYVHAWEKRDIEGHGIFTWALLGALESTAADASGDGTVSFSELIRHVEISMKEKGTERPVLGGKFTDVALGYAPGTVERCDGIDNNFDGKVDEGFPDANHDGLADCLAKELCNGIDDNGDGQVDEGFDLDRDGFKSRELCGSVYGADCNDTEISIHPDQNDWGNLRDDDCDGLLDEDDFDRNKDGIPDLMGSREARAQRAKYSALGGTVGMFVAAAASYLQVVSMNQIAHGTDSTSDVAVVTPEDRSRVRVLSWLTAGLGTGSVLMAGVTVHFGLKARDLRHDFFPPKKKPAKPRKGS